MKYVKNTVLLLALAILGVMLVPPGEDTAEERDGETGDRPAAEAVAYVIKFSAGGSYQPGARPHGIGEPLQGLTKVIEAFEARYPDTRIETVTTPGVREYLVTQLSSGAAPDILNVNVEDSWKTRSPHLSASTSKALL